MRRWFVAGFVVVLLAAAGIAGALAARDLLRPEWRTEPVRLAEIAGTVTVQGIVRPSATAEVWVAQEGRVAEVAVAEGQEVAAGQVLARILPVDDLAQRLGLDAALRDAEASVAVARADREGAQAGIAARQADTAVAAAELRRAEALLDEAIRDHQARQGDAARGAATAGDVAAAERSQDTAERETAVLRAKVRQAEARERIAVAALGLADARIARAEADLASRQAERGTARDRTAAGTLRAPIAGTVRQIGLSPGQRVAPAAGAAAAVVIVSAAPQVAVEADLDEIAFGRIALGQDARMTTPAWPGETYGAVLERLRPSPSGEPGRFLATFAADNPNGHLAPGMTVELVVAVRPVARVPALPVAALRFRPSGHPDAGQATAGRATIYVPGPDGMPRAVPVSIGVADGSSVELLDGLKPGDRVIVGEGPGLWQRARWR